MIESNFNKKIQTFIENQNLYIDMEIEKEKDINRELILKGRSLEVACL
jgi:hypothetical protein